MELPGSTLGRIMFAAFHASPLIPSGVQTGNLSLVGADLCVRPGLRAHTQVRPYRIEAFLTSTSATWYEALNSLKSRSQPQGEEYQAGQFRWAFKLKRKLPMYRNRYANSANPPGARPYAGPYPIAALEKLLRVFFVMGSLIIPPAPL